MNSGILDAHNLAYRIVEGLSENSLQAYSQERISSVKFNIDIANRLFETSIQIAKTLGLDIRNLDLWTSAVKPFSKYALTRKIFQMGVSMGSKHLDSDLICQGLSENLQRKNLHIPLLVLDNEFQTSIIGAKTPGESINNSKPRNTMTLIPVKPVKVLAKSSEFNGQSREGHISLRKLFSSVSESTFEVYLSEGTTIQTTRGPLHIIRDSQKEILSAEGLFITLQELKQIIPGEGATLVVRRDDYCYWKAP